MAHHDHPDEVEGPSPGTVNVEMVQLGVALGGRQDRPAIIAVPRDVTEAEMLLLVMAVVDPSGLRAQLRPPSRIVLPPALTRLPQ